MSYYSSQQDDQQLKPPSRKWSYMRRVVLCVSALLICFGTVQLILYLTDLVSSRQTTEQLREFATEPDPSEEPDGIAAEELVSAAPSWIETPVPTSALPEEFPVLSDILPVVEYPNGYELVPRIRKLRKKSDYIIGWITMEEIDEPVVQKDNTFFLDHDATGNRNNNGAIFMDQGISLVTRPYTILLYGHNMKTGAMFGNLRKYEDFGYCYRHRVFQFDTLYEEGQYVVFATEIIRVVPGTSGYTCLNNLQTSDREVRRKAIKELTDQSIYDALLDVNEEDQILLLLTCVGNDDERLVVAARRLRESEQADRLELRKSI